MKSFYTFLMMITIAFLTFNISYSQKMKFNSNAVVKIFNYGKIEIVEIDMGLLMALPKAGHGSGIILDSSGIILTNAHIVENSSALAVLIPGKDNISFAELIYKKHNPENGIDYAFIQIKGYYEDFVSLPNTTPHFEHLDDVFVWGYTLDFENPSPSVVSGIISQKNEKANLWQIDATINPGYSGGPVTNSDGSIIGINVSMLAGGEGKYVHKENNKRLMSNQ